MAGRPFKYTPEQLEQKFKDYIHWNKTENKFYKRELLKSGERAGEIVDVDITPPLTIVGFCVYAEITKAIFFEWLSDSNHILFDIVTRIREQIEHNQIAGASLDLFNPSIVARLNGLNDTINIESNTQPVINISLPGIGSNFTQLKESNPIDIEYQEVKAIELTDLNE